MDMTFANKGGAPLTDFAIMFNKNSFSLTNADQLVVPQLAPTQSHKVTLKMMIDPEKLGMAQPLNKVTIKSGGFSMQLL